MEFDFSGWATKAGLKCSDGLTIMKDAFKHCDGITVPLVWNHQHNDPNEILGHALLKNEPEGVKCYAKFNDTERGKTAKLLIQHGDINSLSIYANKLKKNMNNVLHGDIREVSLVLAGANPGAFIDCIMAHSDSSDEEAIIYTGEELILELEHSDDSTEIEHADTEDKKEEKQMSENKDKTIGDIIATMTEEQQNAFYGVIGELMSENEGGNEDMKHNTFDQEGTEVNDVLSHDDMKKIMSDAKRYGSLKDAVNQNGYTEVNVLKHSLTDDSGNEIEYGISNIDYLFPDARNMTNQPQRIKEDTSWVAKVLRGAKHSPFSRIKTLFADMTTADIRARGYIKGNLKLEDVFGLLKRSTTPCTVYKKRKLDKDDIDDIVDFDVVSWIKSDMREGLDEEIARAALIGDGRSASSDDKINEQNIRPILTDAELFVLNKDVDVAHGATTSVKAEKAMETAIRARKDYKGSGSLTLFTTTDFLTDCLLVKDLNGRRIYETEADVAKAFRVKEIVTVPIMENVTNSDNKPLIGIMVDMSDYSFGADKGGAVNLFDDFDIDYNQQKYLIETRCSGALIKPYSAIVLWLDEAAA